MHSAFPFISAEIEGVSHHQLKEVVVLNAAADVGVVGKPLVLSYVPIFSIGVTKGVMRFQGVKELVKHIIFRPLAQHHIRVSPGVVSELDVRNVQHAITIYVHLLERQQADILSSSIHFANNSSYELIIRNYTSSICVESLENSIDFFVIIRDTVVTHRFSELIPV